MKSGILIFAVNRKNAGTVPNVSLLFCHICCKCCFSAVVFKLWVVSREHHLRLLKIFCGSRMTPQKWGLTIIFSWSPLIIVKCESLEHVSGKMGFA